MTIGVWGIGITKATAFTYLSLGGLRVRIDVLGGTSRCAVGGIGANLTNYTQDNALADARDLYGKTAAWLAAHPPAGGVTRHVSFAGHSWGGAVVEYAAKNLAQLHDELGDLPLAFTVAAGVPQMIIGYTFQGPGLKVLETTHGATKLDTTLVEIDRPDDPVHQLQFSKDMDGHQYDIMFGDDFQGSYGITTTELSCRGTPGPCP